MLLDSRTVELTRRFYEWELRGRGWARYQHPVALEPPFAPFPGHLHEATRPLDDSRRQTWLSSFVEKLLGASTEPMQTGAALESFPADENPGIPDEAEVAEFLIASPEDARIQRSGTLGWLTALSSTNHPIAFELLGGSRRVEVRLATARTEASHVLRQLQAAIPRSIAIEAPETLKERWNACSSGAFAVVEFGLAREFMVPLVCGARPIEEPLLPTIAALAEVGEGELGVFQILFEQTRHPWDRSLLRAVLTSSGKPFFADSPEVTAFAKEKVSSPLFAAVLRIGAWSERSDRALEIVRSVAAGLSQFGSSQSNELMPLPTNDLEELQIDLLERSTHRSGMLLSAEELVSFVQLPGSGVRVAELWRANERTKSAPAEVTSGAGCLLGTNLHRGQSIDVRLPVETKTKHVHVVGSSGTGKSTLLVQMILEDIQAGHGVGVLDPHGDLVNEVASRIPDTRLSDVVYFDPSDEKASIGWNILGADSELEKDLLASDLVGVFRRLSTSWGDQMTAVLANAVLVFLESPRGGTLEDLRRFLVEEKFRNEILATVTDSYSTSFWRTEFPLLIGRKPQAPILTRLDMFLRSKLIRRVVAVRNPRLDFKHVTDGGLVFLGKLAAGAIGEDNAALLGSLLVSKFHQVTLARQVQGITYRRPFFLYIDEFHHVATPSMATLFSGMRKYQLGLTVAHQDLFQLHQSVPEVERSLMANAYSRICFRLGEEDARQLSRGLDFFEAEDLMRLGVGEAICRVGARGADFNLRSERLTELDSEVARERRELIRELSNQRWGASESTEAAPLADLAQSLAESAKLPAPLQATRREPALHRQEESSKLKPVPETALRTLLDKLGLDYLEQCAIDPFLSVRERNKQLNLSAWRGDRLKDDLLTKGLVREVAINPGGRGERFKLLELTRGGRELLDAFKIAAPSGYGRGGLAHQWWVKRIAEWLEEQGVEATVEDDSSGERVDLSFSTRGRAIAIEVELCDGHALENAKKDLAAGYSSVVCLAENSIALERIRVTLEANLGDRRDFLLFGELRAFEEVITPLIFTHPPPLRPPNQNEERSRRSVSDRRRLVAQASISESPHYSTQPGALTTPAAADYLGLSPATLETMRTRGGGPVFAKLGARVVYKREDLDQWMENRRRSSTSDPGGRSI